MTDLKQSLSTLVADYSVLYQKLRSYHWNVEGPMFFQLHDKFEELYLQIAESIDQVAERLRTLGHTPPSTLSDFLEISRLKEDGKTKDGAEQVKRLSEDFSFVNTELRKVAEAAAQASDEGTDNLLSDLADEQEKTVWMLKSFLGS